MSAPEGGPPTLAELNAQDLHRFVALLGAVFEHAPWVAERAWHGRPFESIDALHARMCAEVQRSGAPVQLALLRAHPQLAGRAARRGDLTAASAQEQRSAGLDQCSAEELARISRGNSAYLERFGFPFIIAVRGRSRGDILAALEQRLGNDPRAEFTEAMRQVEAIALLRLRAAIAPPATPAS